MTASGWSISRARAELPFEAILPSRFHDVPAAFFSLCLHVDRLALVPRSLSLARLAAAAAAGAAIAVVATTMAVADAAVVVMLVVAAALANVLLFSPRAVVHFLSFCAFPSAAATFQAAQRDAHYLVDSHQLSPLAL